MLKRKTSEEGGKKMLLSSWKSKMQYSVEGVIFFPKTEANVCKELI